MTKLSINFVCQIILIAWSFALSGLALAQSDTEPPKLREPSLPMLSGNKITIDTNQSCMSWQLNQHEIGQSTMLSGCGSNFNPAKKTMRGNCQLTLPDGQYNFRYGGVHGYILDVTFGQISYTGTKPPKVQGLILSQDKIQFNTAAVKMEGNGFPGTFNIEGEIIDPSCSNAPKNIAHLMRGAHVLVSGEWPESPTNHQHGSEYFIIDGDDLLKPSNQPKGIAAPYFAHNDPKTLSPNLYYWNNLKQGLSTNKSKPVLVVSGENCPAGFKLWKDGKGRFLLGAGAAGDYDEYGETKKAKLGKMAGENNVILRKRHLPKHEHAYQRTEKNEYAHKGGGSAIGVTGGLTPHFNTDDSGNLKGKAHNNIPPYMAVNFCVPDHDVNVAAPVSPERYDQPCYFAG